LAGIALFAFLFFGQEVSAQNGTLTARVTDSETQQPLGAAQIQILGGGQEMGGLTNESGVYSVQLPAGTYDIIVTLIGHLQERFDGIRVDAGATTRYEVVLRSAALELNELNVTVGRGSTPEKATDSPGTVDVISAYQISERVVTQVSDHLRSSPGVDVVNYGLQGSNVVVRGFNNIFSGALHMLTDNRVAGVPSLRVNLMHFVPSNEQDIERMEVVLGPASALYGPNTANGVVHILTKSPLNDQGTSVTLGGGERGVLQGSFRSAFLLNEDFGFKISGQYMRGDEWEFNDPTEARNRQAADDDPALCLQDRLVRGIPTADAQEACDRTGLRDYDIERYGFEARADWRFADDGTFVATYGRNNSSGVELTGLGAGQTVDWIYEFYQARIRKGRLFTQAYMNSSDAGESYLLNNGVNLVDLSKLYVAQAQHGIDFADGRQDFTYGFDYIATRPNTEGNINGIYEDDDDMNEWGVYLQSKTALSDMVDLIFAGRLDSHSVLPENVISPRAALVIKPTEDQSFRLSYNQAYSSPSSLNYFLDISNGLAPGLEALGFGLRAFGTGREGWSLLNADGTLEGFRSPFNPAGAGVMVPMAGAANFWGAALAVAAAQSPDLAALVPILGALTPTPADIAPMLYDLSTGGDPIPLSAANLPAVESITESNTETFEVGWTGVLDDRVKLTGDLYYTKKNNFVSPLLIQTPLVTLNGNDIGAFIAPTLVPIFVAQYIAAGVDPATAQQMALADVGGIAAGLAGVPIGVVSSSTFPGGSDLIVTYRNVGDLTLWGGDLAFQWLVNDNWTLDGTYSYVSDDLFAIDDGSDIALNAPKHKGSMSLAYRSLYSGFSAQARFRFNNEFPAISAGFDGLVPSSQVVDVNIGYKVPNTGATMQLAVQNVFDSDYQSFVGVPTMGRLALVRVKYDLF
jgi:iron complex outermembrane receptor protein